MCRDSTRKVTRKYYESNTNLNIKYLESTRKVPGMYRESKWKVLDLFFKYTEITGKVLGN